MVVSILRFNIQYFDKYYFLIDSKNRMRGEQTQNIIFLLKLPLYIQVLHFFRHLFNTIAENEKRLSD